MMLFIALLFFLIMAFIQIAIYSRINRGQQLTHIQSNVTASYLRLSARFGQSNYRVFGSACVVLFAVLALIAGAWIVTLVMLGYTYVALRTQRLIDRTDFMPVDRQGVPNTKGIYLYPNFPRHWV